MAKPPMPLIPGEYFHIYNRGNNGEQIFKEERNYAFFLQKYCTHVAPVVDTYAYNLLGNHFHLLVRIKPISEWEIPIPENVSVDLPMSGALFVSSRFSNFFNAYSKSINKAYDRTGSLFEKPFERTCIDSEDYFDNALFYIHFNGQKHGFTDDFREWPHSSYHSYLSDCPSKLARAEVLEKFGGKAGFIAFHERKASDHRPDDMDWGDYF